MKLNIGDNIRKYRKQTDMTQEQLADKLGTTYQSVSRWENGTTYPDMELLPVLAKMFNVSVDELLGIPDKKKEEAAVETFTKLAQTCAEKPVDTEKVIGLIQDIRMNYLDGENLWHFWLIENNNVYRMPELLPEVRLTVETILESDLDMQQKNRAISFWAEIEDDEHIKKFLEKYASERDLTKDRLCSHRFRIRNEWEKDEPLRQLFLFQNIKELVGNGVLCYSLNQLGTIQNLRATNDFQLNLLHSLCGQIPDENHPISANGEIDIWIYDRLWLGFHRACYFAASHDTEMTFIILNDVVLMMETVMKIAAPTELHCTSPWLEQFVWTAHESWLGPSCSQLLTTDEERCIVIQRSMNEQCYVIFPSYFQDILNYRVSPAYPKVWHGFDSIRDDARYQGYIDRINALIVTRPKQK